MITMVDADKMIDCPVACFSIAGALLSNVSRHMQKQEQSKRELALLKAAKREVEKKNQEHSQAYHTPTLLGWRSSYVLHAHENGESVTVTPRE